VNSFEFVFALRTRLEFERLFWAPRERLLKYGIAIEPDTGSVVSFASLAID